PKVSEKRIKDAHDTYEKRKGNNQDLSLLECLQFCDKRDLLAKSENFRKDFNISRKQFDSFVKQVEKIRNELAHSQNSIISNIEWPVFVETVSRLEDFLIRSDVKVEHLATEGNDFQDLLVISV
ncbi:MAG: CBS domain-containing protein, partial [Candidatus Heimdallarchaeota archaeon]